MHNCESAPSSTETLLASLARTFLWHARPDEQNAIEGQVRAALDRTGNPEFDIETWARDLLRDATVQDANWSAAENGPSVVRAGPYIGICINQEWNERRELIAAVQLHPDKRAVLVEAGIERLERSDVVATMRDEIESVLTRARFLGIDQLAVEHLCQEALAVSRTLEVEQLWAETAATPTLGDGEGMNQFVRVVGIQLHEPFRVTLAFDDGVSRSLDLAPFLQEPDFTPVRRPGFFIQLRLSNGTLRWPNGASIDPVQLRYAPALTLQPNR